MNNKALFIKNNHYDIFFKKWFQESYFVILCVCVFVCAQRKNVKSYWFEEVFNMSQLMWSVFSKAGCKLDGINPEIILSAAT